MVCGDGMWAGGGKQHGWERRNRAGGRGKRRDRRAEGHRHDKDVWRLSLTLCPGWAQLAVQGVCSRGRMHIEHSQAMAGGLLWGSPWGREHIPGGRGGGGLEQVPGQRQWGRKECWSNAGGSKATSVLHTSASWGCPLFPDNGNWHPSVSKATSAWDGDPAGCDALVYSSNNRDSRLLSGANKPAAPQAVLGLGFKHPPAPDHTSPCQPKGSFPLLGHYSSLSHFRAPSGMSRAGVLPLDHWALSPPPTTELFRDVCLSQRTPCAEEGGAVGPASGSPATSQDPSASQQPACTLSFPTVPSCASVLSMLPQVPAQTDLRWQPASETWGSGM